jgi:asparagine synthase (glutamine-hydrolysing)
MCGLIAALLPHGDLSPQRVEGALAAILHRGPDRTSWWFSADHRMMLGHVRLSIVGLQSGDQPIVSEAGDMRCVVNGEFYGYRRIREELRAEGRHFATTSDSEIALHLYDKLGTECVHALRGEFAVVIADERRRRLVAIRDRFGIKPLFYTVHEGAVFFASEIKALLALGAPARWDQEAFFAECHAVRPSSRSLFAGIYSVPPGCLAIAREGAVEIRRYWDVDFPSQEALAGDQRSEKEIVAGFRRVLEESVRERMVADVEVACYLSGGIDSCAVLGLAQRHASRPIRAFSITFENDAVYDELQLAEKAAALAGAVLVPVPVSQAQIADAFAETIWHTESLLYNGHSMAKYLLSEAVRDAGIKVVLTGEGSDEMLAGYPPFRRDMILHGGAGGDGAESRRLIAELDAANQASRAIFGNDGKQLGGLEVFETRLGWIPSSMESFSTIAGRLYPLFHDDVRAAGVTANPYTELLDQIDLRGQLGGRDPLNQALYLWGKVLLPNYILTALGDRVEMAHSVEGRVPFLDHLVAEYAARLPVSYKIHGMREKYVLREAVRDCVPVEVYERQKHPFMTPPARSANDPLSVYCQDVLRSAAADEQPFFAPKRLHALMDRVATMPAEERAGFDSVILTLVSTCVMQERFGLAA